MNPRSVIKSNWQIIVILLFAATLRFFRIEALTTFGGDQGYDFLIVKRIIVDHHFTLLGPKIGPYNAIGNLYLGPAYYYLLAIPLVIFSLDPIGPAIFTATLAVLTVFVIYLICLKFLSKNIALLASALYAFNGFLIDQSRAASNPHFIPFFSAMTIFSAMQIFQKNSKLIIWPVVIGASLGIMFQLHYLSGFFLPLIALIMVFKKQLKVLILTIASFLVFMSPQIIFELRHNFFVTNLFINQLKYGNAVSDTHNLALRLAGSFQTIASIIKISLTSQLVFLLILFIFLKKFKNLKRFKFVLSFLFTTIILNLVLLVFYSGSLETHYFSPVYISLIILTASILVFVYESSKSYFLKALVIFLTLIIFITNVFNLNLTRNEGYTMPKGWNQIGIKAVSNIVAAEVDTQKKFNVASTLDGDTRARPYRYLLEVKGKIPQDVEAYPSSDILYLVSRDEEEKIKSYTVWEVASFAPFDIVKKWPIQNGIWLYRLEKKHD